MPSFEESLPIINKVIERKRKKWTLHAVSWYSYDDFAQEVRCHIFKKFHLYDQTRPIEPWVDRIVSYQMINKLETLYHSHKRPCLNCPFNQGGDHCEKYHIQGPECPEFLQWVRSGKSDAFNVKMPVSLNAKLDDSYNNELSDCIGAAKANLDFDQLTDQFHTAIKKILTPFEARVYDALFIRHLSEREAAKEFYSTLRQREESGGATSSGVREIKKIKNRLFEKAKLVVKDVI